MSLLAWACAILDGRVPRRFNPQHRSGVIPELVYPRRAGDVVARLADAVISSWSVQ